MGIILLILFGVLLKKFVDRFGPDIGAILGPVFLFLFLCIGITLKLLGRLLRWLVRTLFRLSWTGLRAAWLFGRIFIEEWRRPSAAADSTGADEAPAEAGPDPYASALARLGLASGFTREDLSRAYKRAMLAAHPDAGGSTEDATAVNVARDLIRARMGWA